MKQEYSISIYLDQRRAKANGKFPIRLRVFTSTPRKQKLYPTVFDMSPKEFDSVWKTDKPRNEHKAARRKLSAVEVRAYEVAGKLNPFTFDQFERRLFRNASDGVNVSYHYQQMIDSFVKHKQLGTASTYDLSRKSLKEYSESSKNKKFDNLTFFDITTEWLKDYEFYMTEAKGRSLTTVSMYLRALRAIFNKAIDEKEIEQDFYPFGKRKYQVPSTRNVKKAMSGSQLKTLMESKTLNAQQQKAKDFWFFSYFCNGMNMKDIALLKYKDIQEGKIEFIRAKTRTTSKGNQKPVVAYLNSFTEGIIKRYGNQEKQPDSFVFDIVRPGLTAKEEQAKIKNFTRFVNQHIKQLCKANQLPENISTYWARHSFTTSAVRKGATMEFVQESLGHENITTTQNYFAGFDSETKKEFADSLLNFD